MQQKRPEDIPAKPVKPELDEDSLALLHKILQGDTGAVCEELIFFFVLFDNFSERHICMIKNWKL